MQRFLTPLALAFALAFTSACATASVKPADVQAAISAAKAAQKKAASVGYEWRDTGKMIKKAEALAKKGELEKAMKLAEMAKFQGEMAYKQYLDQKDVQPRY